jgi:MSHA biogenesis protein MshP
MTRKDPISGMALISAVFLIVVILALAAVVLSLSTVQQDTGTKSLLTARVYYGAKAGLEWGIQQAIATGACAGATWGPGTNPMQGALASVSVTVTCTASAYAGGTVYYLTSQATTGTIGNLNYAERHLEATVSNIP